MGLIEKLRKAEEQGKQAARNAFERAKELGEDTERRIRQKMRIYPPCAAGTAETSRRKAAGVAAGGQRRPSETVRSEQEREPIVSVHGEDLEKSDKVA